MKDTTNSIQDVFDWANLPTRDLKKLRKRIKKELKRRKHNCNCAGKVHHCE